MQQQCCREAKVLIVCDVTFFLSHDACRFDGKFCHSKSIRPSRLQNERETWLSPEVPRVSKQTAETKYLHSCMHNKRLLTITTPTYSFAVRWDVAYTVLSTVELWQKQECTVNETFSFETETRPRPRRFSRCRKRYSLLSFWFQTATNYPVFRSFISISNCPIQKLSRHFPKTVSNLKKLLFCIVLHSCTRLCNEYLITIFRKNKKLTNWSSCVIIV